MPHDFAPWKTVYDDYRQWTRAGLWAVLGRYLGIAVRRQAGKRPAPTAAILDRQSVKTDSARDDVGYDAAKKIRGRKRHLLVDTLGLLLAVPVTGADVQDRDGARRRLAGALLLLGRLQLLWADVGAMLGRGWRGSRRCGPGASCGCRSSPAPRTPKAFASCPNAGWGSAPSAGLCATAA